MLQNSLFSLDYFSHASVLIAAVIAQLVQRRVTGRKAEVCFPPGPRCFPFSLVFTLALAPTSPIQNIQGIFPCELTGRSLKQTTRLRPVPSQECCCYISTGPVNFHGLTLNVLNTAIFTFTLLSLWTPPFLQCQKNKETWSVVGRIMSKPTLMILNNFTSLWFNFEGRILDNTLLCQADNHYTQFYGPSLIWYQEILPNLNCNYSMDLRP